MNISTARVARQINVPISILASKTNFQGAMWAKDPNTGAESFFQMQAKATSFGDVEDLYVHRYSLKGDVLTYQDTMIGRGLGHCQTGKARISSAGNANLWLGLEMYDAKGAKIGQQVFKIMYRKGEMSRTSKYVTRIWTGGNWASPLDCPDWTVVLRRPAGDSEVYEWYDERELFEATATLSAKPTKRITVPKADKLQSACATGTYAAPGSVFRINGMAEDSPQWLTQFPTNGLTSQLDVTNIITGSGGGTVEEPEAVLSVRGELWVGKQTSPYTKSRILAYMPLRLT